jgi:plastocyanin
MMRKSIVVALTTGLLMTGVTLAEDTGTIKGKATFKGGREAVPDQFQPKLIDTKSADPNCTKKIGTTQARAAKEADGAGLQWVMVSIEKGLPEKSYDPPAEPAELDQNGCEYHPHVLGVMKGQELLVKNSDNTSHNIHGLAKKNDEFNKSQPKKGMEFTLKFAEIEQFFTKCDVHPWMGCYIQVFEHPFFAVSDKDGSYEIKNVPPGKYTLKFWHETFGEKSVDVEVSGPGSTAEANAEFDAP